RPLLIDDPETWLKALESALHDDAQRARLEERGFDHVKPYDWKRVAQQFVDDAVNHLKTRDGIEVPEEQVPPESISCILVSSGGLSVATSSIDDFLAQTYPERELMVVTPPGPLADFVNALNRPDVRPLLIDDPDLSARDLYSRGVAETEGAILCLWDENVRYHPARLEVQWQEMTAQQADASVLNEQLYFHEETQALYWLAWDETTPVQGLLRSLMVRRTAISECPEFLEAGSLGEAGDPFSTQGPFIRVHGRGILHLYFDSIWRPLSVPDRSRALRLTLDEAALARHLERLQQELPGFNLPMPLTINTRGQRIITAYNQ
ncbi:MAG: hypothetical protein AAF492_28225, partial [Verrucomicrobiota bacterium]